MAKNSRLSDGGGQSSTMNLRRTSHSTSLHASAPQAVVDGKNLKVPTRNRRHSNDHGFQTSVTTVQHSPTRAKSMTVDSFPSSPDPSTSTVKGKAMKQPATGHQSLEQMMTPALLLQRAGYAAPVDNVPPQPADYPLGTHSSSQHIHKNGNHTYGRQPYTPLPALQPFYANERYSAELTNCIIAFLSPILPTEEEYRMKEVTRRQLERLAQTVSPGARLLMFGSNSNGFALKSSDMDLCCLLTPDEREKSASDLVESLGQVLRQQTDYTVMTLPKARIPIIKIHRPPSVDMPYDLSCDIGFENRLALENTRLLLSYAMVDAPRLRTLVLFLKVWAKRRKLNSPFTGTLSSYGYTLMMLYFLIHIKRPAVLPNLQRFGAPREILESTATYFFDDVTTLRREWTTSNTETVGELLMEFFRFFAKDFSYSREVISIRSEFGTFAKDHHTWNADLCIEDPFGNYNVARPVTKDGLYTIRGEFIRASRILGARTDRVSAALAELCEEREDSLTRAPEPSQYQRYHRVSHVAPTIGQYDPRYLRDLTRRLESGAMFNKGGSFAFEEMARGLAQAQQGGVPIPFPPTTAMLAPLSQNVGLVKNGLMRAGLRYDANQRAPPHNLMGNVSVPTTPRLSSSAWSEPSYVRKSSEGHDKGKTGTAKSNSGNVSMQSSPRLLNSAASPDAGSLYGVGEAFAFGSEITFGTQRFHLYPQESVQKEAHRQERAMSNADMLSPSSAAFTGETSCKAGRSFSEGLNRSMSLPRQASGLERRSSTPAVGEAQSQDYAGQNSTKALPRRSSDALSNPTVSDRGSPCEAVGRSPFLTAAPWTFVAPGIAPAPTAKPVAPLDGRGLGLLDDEIEFRTNVSDGTIDDAARASLLESSTGPEPSDGDEGADDSDLPSEGACNALPIKTKRDTLRLSAGRASDVVAWTVSQREQIDLQRRDNDQH